MYIDNGPNQGFPNTVILVSKDGIVWDTIRKSRITRVGSRFQIGWNNPGINPYQFTNLARITMSEGTNTILDFDIQEVVNQPTWVGGTQAQLITAVNDINLWMI